ncbi:MAG: transporter substrate-binding domain-containing protein [Chthoniobacter sp.]|nr:transporter substrate-binding domain-containing protein [Chthoniobacter sp.]
MRFPLILLLACALPALLAAQEPAAPAKKITVLVKPAKPFAFDKAGDVAGYSIDLWKRVAEEAKLDYEFKPVATVPEALDALKNQHADVALGAISITAEREAVVDFSYPYYKSGLQILVNSESTKSPFRAFLKLDIFKILGLLIVAIVINAHILWFFERRKGSDSFDTNYREGILNALWWSVCFIITLGCENIAPTRVAGRLLGVVWMLAGVALYSYVTATLTTTMTKDALQSDIRTVSDLQGQEVGTVTGSSAAHFLESNQVTAKGYADVDAACHALDAGEIKAVVYDEPLLKFYLSNNSNTKLHLVGDLFEKQDYGFALVDKSPLRKEINRALLKLGEEGYFDELEKKWFTASP